VSFGLGLGFVFELGALLQIGQHLLGGLFGLDQDVAGMDFLTHRNGLLDLFIPRLQGVVGDQRLDLLAQPDLDHDGILGALQGLLHVGILVHALLLGLGQQQLVGQNHVQHLGIDLLERDLGELRALIVIDHGGLVDIDAVNGADDRVLGVIGQGRSANGNSHSGGERGGAQGADGHAEDFLMRNGPPAAGRNNDQ